MIPGCDVISMNYELDMAGNLDQEFKLSEENLVPFALFIPPVEDAPSSLATQSGVGSAVRYRKSAVDWLLHSRKDQKMLANE